MNRGFRNLVGNSHCYIREWKASVSSSHKIERRKTSSEHKAIYIVVIPVSPTENQTPRVLAVINTPNTQHAG
jgi:hypothetical protein